MVYSLDDLKKQAAAAAEINRKRVKLYMREGYELARSLGFSSSEAAVLRGKKRETIIRLSEEKADDAQQNT